MMIRKKTAGVLIFLAMLVPALAQSDTFQPTTAKVTASALNVRNVASSGGVVVGSVKQGDVVNAIERSNSKSTIDGINEYWYKITLPGNKSGWVFGGFLSFEVNMSDNRVMRWRSVYPERNENYTSIAVSSSGEILTGTVSGRLFISGDGGSAWKKVQPQALGVSIGQIKKIVSAGGVIWIGAVGTAGGGLWKSTNNGASWTQITTSQGLLSNDVVDIAVDGQKVYAATEDNLSVSTDGGMSFRAMDPEVGETILSVAVYSGKLFVGTEDGLYSIIDGKWRQIGSRSANMGDEVYCVAVSAKGDIFAGTDKGLNRGSAADLNSWFVIGGRNRVNSLFVDLEGRVIAGTDDGLNVSADGGVSWQTYKTEHGLSWNVTGAATVDRRNKIWVVSGLHGLSYSE